MNEQNKNYNKSRTPERPIRRDGSSPAQKNAPPVKRMAPPPERMAQLTRKPTPSVSNGQRPPQRHPRPENTAQRYQPRPDPRKENRKAPPPPPPRRRNDESYVFSRSLSETRERIMEERRERLEDAKRFRQEDINDKVRKGLIAFGATILLIVVIVSIIISSALNRDTVKKSKGEYTYLIGDEKSKEEYSAAVRNGEIYISMNSIAELCDLTLSGNLDNDFRFYTPDGTWISFAPNSSSATINGYGMPMPAPAYINGTVCNVPLEFLSHVMGGIEVSINEQSNTVTVKRLEYSDSTPLEPHYLDVVFTLKINASLDSIEENKYFAGQPLFTFKNDLSEYESCMNPTGDLRDAFLMLLNKENPIDSSFEPSSIVDLPESIIVPSKRGSVTLELDSTAAKALEAMILEMHSAGFDNVFVTSAYREYSYQSALYNTYIEREMKTISSDAYSVLGKDYIEANYTSQGITKLTREDAIKVVNSYSAIPGYSEHHTGLCVDLMSTDMSDLTNAFAEKEVFSWLCANAWKFGFVLRYPEDKVDITGYSYESWHWRFVGRTHALAMLSSGKCLEEYLASLPQAMLAD